MVSTGSTQHKNIVGMGQVPAGSQLLMMPHWSVHWRAHGVAYEVPLKGPTRGKERLVILMIQLWTMVLLHKLISINHENLIRNIIFQLDS